MAAVVRAEGQREYRIGGRNNIDWRIETSSTEQKHDIEKLMIRTGCRS